MISSLSLHNFKCYKNQSFNFSKLTIFCGSNSVGKSTAIQALALAFQSGFSEKIMISGSLVDLGSSADIFSAYADDGDDSLSISISFEDPCIKNLQWIIEHTSDQRIAQNSLRAINYNEEVKKTICETYFKKFGFQFIEAERFGPRDYFKTNRNDSSLNWLGSKGEYAYEIYSSLDNSIKRLNSEDPRIHKCADDGSTVRRNINYWMSEIAPNFIMESAVVKEARISHATFQANNSDKNSPVNMGFGLSYVLSVVIALLITEPGGLVIIENPEAHLHPRGQSYLGRLIALSSLSGVQVIIETHSDHLLNGVRVIARTNKGYSEGDFTVHFISSTTSGGNNVTTLDIGKKGEVSEWPQGFFDQQAKDIKAIIKGSDE